MGSVNLSLIFFTRNLKEEKRAHTVWDCRANSTCLQPFKGSWVGAPCVRARLRITHSRCKTQKGQRNPGINHNHELLTNPKTENRTSSKPRLGSGNAAKLNGHDTPAAKQGHSLETHWNTRFMLGMSPKESSSLIN